MCKEIKFSVYISIQWPTTHCFTLDDNPEDKADVLSVSVFTIKQENLSSLIILSTSCNCHSKKSLMAGKTLFRVEFTYESII